MFRISRPLAIAVLLGSALGANPRSALAQTSQFYVPPKIVKQGTASSAIAGSGKVTVKVLIRKDGSLGSASIVKSTNHADNDAALQIAKSATYKAGTHDGKPGDAFYTYVLAFNGKSVAVDVSGEDTLNQSAVSGQMESINALMSAAKYADARTQLTAYLTTHSDDHRAAALLGAANYYLNDFDAAATAFDQAGTVPPAFVAVAYNSYTQASDDGIQHQHFDAAVADATHAAALQPTNPVPYFYRGTAETYQHNTAQAIADLEKAKSLVNAQTPVATVNTIDTALAQAYFAGNQPDKGVALAQQLRTSDPNNTQIGTILANHYIALADTEAKAGHTAQAVADYEQVAQLVPAKAAISYQQAAVVLGNAAKTPDDNKKALVELKKSLALAPNDPQANYTAAVLSVNAGDSASARAYLQTAKTNVGSDSALATKIDDLTKKLGPK
jgi:TonB family protein